MEQHCIIGHSSLVTNGLQQYLEFQRQASVARIPLNELKMPDWAGLRNVQFLWIDLIQETKGLLKLCQKILQHQPHSKVFVFGEFKDPKTIRAIFKTGISGYLLPSCGIHCIKDAIHKADLGTPYVDPQLTEILMDSIVQPQLTASNHRLTRREKQILRLIVAEYTTQEIANELFISFCTVETHRLHLIQKMGVRNTAGLVREAMSARLLD